jgi:hypothetical protein
MMRTFCKLSRESGAARHAQRAAATLGSPMYIVHRPTSLSPAIREESFRRGALRAAPRSKHCRFALHSRDETDSEWQMPSTPSPLERRAVPRTVRAMNLRFVHETGMAATRGPAQCKVWSRGTVDTPWTPRTRASRRPAAPRVLAVPRAGMSGEECGPTTVMPPPFSEFLLKIVLRKR